MTILIAILGGIGTILVSILSGFFGSRLEKTWEGRKEQAREKRLRANLLHHIACDSLEQMTEWVQFFGQALGNALSRSKPLTLVTPDQILELIKLGAPTGVVKSIQAVQRLFADVTAQVERAQDEYSRCVADQTANGEPIILADQQQPFETFANALAFIRDEWPKVKAGVDCLIKATEADGIPMAEERKRFEELVRKYDGLHTEYLAAVEAEKKALEAGGR